MAMKRLPVLLCAAALLGAGCASTDERPGDGGDAWPRGGNQGAPAGPRTGQLPGRDGVGVDPRGDQPAGVPGSRDPLDDPRSLLAGRVIYFELDSADVRAEDRELVRAHADYLVARPDRRLRLEGHADERGTREYNVALGQRRADAVRSLLQLYGVPPRQLSTLSYGEEYPADFGHNERAWSRNRRVELVY